MENFTNQIVSEINSLDEKLNECITTLRETLEKKGIEVVNTDKLLEMIRKVDDINTSTIIGEEKLPPWYQLITKVENIWISANKITKKRRNISTSVHNVNIYCIGGEDSNNNILNDLECYDSNSNTYTVKSNKYTKRRNSISETVGNIIYNIGGYNGWNGINTNESYDINSNTWIVKQSIPTARYLCYSGTVDNKIYCIGGHNNGYLNKNECYDTNSDTWTTKLNLNIERQGHGSTVLNNKIYCIGGFAQEDNSLYQYNINEYYDPNTNSYTVKASAPEKNSAYLTETINNKIYCLYNVGLYMYDPDKNIWNNIISQIPEELRGTGYGYSSGAVDNKIYCIGGYDGKNYLDNNEIYIP